MTGQEVRVTAQRPPWHVETFVRRVPATAVLLGLLLVVGLVTGSFWRPARDAAWFDVVAFGVPALQAGHWWAPLTGAAVAVAPWAYLPTLIGVALLGGAAETRLGTRRLVVLVAALQVWAVVAASAFVASAANTTWIWAIDLSDERVVGVGPAVLGTFVVATGTMPAPWRGRLRFVVVVYCTVGLLYSGSFVDLLRAISVVTALSLTPIVLQRSRLPFRLPRSNHEWRLLASGWVILLFASYVAGTVWPDRGPFVGPDSVSADPPSGLIGGAGMVSLLFLLLADGLRRGRRAAWRWVLALAAVQFVAFAIPPWTVETAYQAVFTTGLVVVLLRGRRAFAVDGGPRRGRQAVLWVAGSFLGLAIYGWLGFRSLSGFGLPVTREAAIGEFLSRLAGSSDTYTSPVPPASWFLSSLTFIGIGVLLASAAVVLWANIPPTPGRREVAEALLRSRGGTSLSWLTVWPGNRYVFVSDDEKPVAYQAFRVHAGVAVGLCDPVGIDSAAHDSADVDHVLASFAARCDTNGWLPCLFSVSDAVARAGRARGWSALQVGEEAIVDLVDLEFRGKAWQDVRTAFNHAERDGIHFDLRPLSQQPFRVLSQVRAISEEWLEGKPLPEMGFTLGGVDEALAPGVLCGLALDSAGTVHGMTTWLPVFAPGGVITGWTLDVVRRRRGGFRPVADYLIASACLEFKGQGVASISLSCAPLARSGVATDETGFDRFLDGLGATLEPLYGFRSLHAFKAKFSPRYVPVYLVYPEEGALARIGIALTRAYLPDAGVRDFIGALRS